MDSMFLLNWIRMSPESRLELTDTETFFLVVAPAGHAALLTLDIETHRDGAMIFRFLPRMVF